jgi:hypothetical protein
VKLAQTEAIARTAKGIHEPCHSPEATGRPTRVGVGAADAKLSHPLSSPIRTFPLLPNTFQKPTVGRRKEAWPLRAAQVYRSLTDFVSGLSDMYGILFRSFSSAYCATGIPTLQRLAPKEEVVQP